MHRAVDVAREDAPYRRLERFLRRKYRLCGATSACFLLTLEECAVGLREFVRAECDLVGPVPPGEKE